MVTVRIIGANGYGKPAEARLEVVGEIVNGLAIHRVPDGWTGAGHVSISHVASGWGVVHYLTLEMAQRALAFLTEGLDWDRCPVTTERAPDDPFWQRIRAMRAADWFLYHDGSTPLDVVIG